MTTPNPVQPDLRSIWQRHILSHIDLSGEALSTLVDASIVCDHARKATMLHAGERWDHLFYIQQGLIRLFYTDTRGRDFNKAFFAEEQAIWPVAPGDRNNGVLFSIAAIEPTTIIQCPFRVLHRVLHRAGLWEEFALPVAETLIEQKVRREHDFLLLSATERLERFQRAAPHIVCRLPDYHLASFLGITNVSLSRIKRLSYDNEKSPVAG